MCLWMMCCPAMAQRRIQVAILLDVSGSMDGLLEQAKVQLWSMVETLGRISGNGYRPQVQLALYEYGRNTNDVNEGYVRQLNGFNTGLDSISKSLYLLTSKGRDEYCAFAIRKALQELPWDTAAGSYKALFICGNEEFGQGEVKIRAACSLAIQQQVIVNTIYCGDSAQGIQEHWKLAVPCNNGSYAHINMNLKDSVVPTPFDADLFRLNAQLNKTYVYYGKNGAASYRLQAEVDSCNNRSGSDVMANRISVKIKPRLYTNATWDAVDALAADGNFLSLADQYVFPDGFPAGKVERAAYLVAKATERQQIQAETAAILAKRKTYLSAISDRSLMYGMQTFHTEIERIITGQVARVGLQVEPY